MPIEGPRALRIEFEKQERLEKHVERKALIISGTLWVVSSIALCAIAYILIAKAVMKGKNTLEKIKHFWKEPLHLLAITPMYASLLVCLGLYSHLIKGAPDKRYALQETMVYFKRLKGARNVEEFLNSSYDEYQLAILEQLEKYELIIFTEEERISFLSKIEEYKKLVRAFHHAQYGGCIPRNREAKEERAALDAFLQKNDYLIGWVQERLREPKVSDDPFEAEGRIRSEVFVRDSEFRDFD